MQERVINSIKRAVAAMLLSLLVCASAQAQSAQIQISQLDKLASKAEQVVEVTLDEKMLQLAAKFLSDKNPSEAAVKQLVGGLKGVYVRVFEFDQPGEYVPGDVESLRTQLAAPGWSKIVGVRSRREGGNVDVHLRWQDGNILGLAIIAADPKQLTVVNIVGPIDLDKLSQLEGQFGIPKLELEKIKGKARNE
jgi:hypothetical protein